MDLYDVPAREMLREHSPRTPSSPQTFESLSLVSPSALSTGSTSSVYTADSKIRRFGQKLAFWRRRKTTAADVQVELEKLAKMHEKYEARLRSAHECVRSWTEYLDPPGHVSRDALQAQLQDKWLSKWTTSMLEILKPVLDLQAQEGLLISSFAHGFQALKDEETSCREIINKLCAAEKKYYKALAASKSGMVTAEYDRERQLLQTQLDDANNRFRLVARRELPLRFQQVVNQMQSMCSTLRPAEAEISELLRKHDSGSASQNLPVNRFASFYSPPFMETSNSSESSPPPPNQTLADQALQKYRNSASLQPPSPKTAEPDIQPLRQQPKRFEHEFNETFQHEDDAAMPEFADGEFPWK